jgi:hypothetical protein
MAGEGGEAVCEWNVVRSAPSRRQSLPTSRAGLVSSTYFGLPPVTLTLTSRPMSFSNTTRSWSPETLREYLQSLSHPLWATAITLHHTAAPSLAQRPHGFTAQHLRNLREYYELELHWRAGPHLFVDEQQLWGMTEFRERGVHASSFNGHAIGIEVLGDYDSEDPLSGRGLACWTNAAAAAAVLMDWLGVSPSPTTVLFHRDDPRTSKTCPGKKVEKAWFLRLMREAGAFSAHG